MASTASQTVLVAGGGIGGIATANRLRRRFDRRHRVVLINREPDFTFAASYLWVMTGARRPNQITRPVQRLERRGIEVVIGDVTDIDPETRTVTVGGQRMTGDHLVISLGADWATDRIPGLAEHGHTFATLTGAHRLAEQLGRVESGRIVVVTAAPLYKCPAAPYEAALLIEAGHVRVFLNDGTLGFAAVPLDLGAGMGWLAPLGDANGDSLADLIVEGEVWLGNSAVTRSPYAAVGGTPVGADLDGDGFADLITVSAGGVVVFY